MKNFFLFKKILGYKFGSARLGFDQWYLLGFIEGFQIH